ncbi:malate dehydrogenase [Spiroplasma chinense]|uniref:Malate dehydrogenase n=1 Tax=Spiroplasma chinense TaxID=216932 RepID=A0A5B9Y6X7_9MOLU|nr:NADP-dependent malic enzyme [Spiroplasma chinense]QEH61842.1 malate dehydrogenase [Spiroplasma chinense]
MKENALELHERLKGKIKVELKEDVTSYEELSIVYSPGVAQPCLEIAKNNSDIYKYTMKGNTVAIISNGTAVLGLGDIGADASLPVMEGKAVLVKKFAGVNAFPICIDEKDPKKLIEIIKSIGTSFGAINLEDIAAPDCFEIERTLQEEMNIPVFHDDQHGTSVIIIAGIINSARLLKKDISKLKITLCGTGAAGYNIAKTVHKLGVEQILAYNKFGVVNSSNKDKNDQSVNELLEKNIINDTDKSTLAEIMEGADVFVGLSAPNIVTSEMVSKMNKDPILFAMANPIPEITFEEISKVEYGVFGTGRSDYPNQVNNVLAFPGILKGLLETDVKVMDEEAKIVIGKAIANLVTDDELKKEFVLPNLFDNRVVDVIVNEMKKL